MGDMGGRGGKNWISSALSSECEVDGPESWCSIAARMNAAALVALDFPLALLLVLTSDWCFFVPPLAAEALPARGDLPSSAARACLTRFTPQALHRVLGPSGPSRH